MGASHTDTDTDVDVVAAMDAAPWSGYQKSVMILAALAVVIDGLDNQMLGFAIPALMRDWNVTRGDFAPIAAASLIVMSVGTAVAGVWGDRLGRRPALIGCVTMFGLATGASAFVNDLTGLLALRLISALGLGGAMPNATALLAEYTPSQRRNLAVTLGIVGVPVGGLVGGLTAAAILPAHGWRALFMIGGVLPLLIAAVMFFALPESPSYLVRRPADRSALLALLRRCGLMLGDDVQFTRPATTSKRQPFLTLFDPGLARDTVALWVAFFACLLCVYAFFNWAPTMLSGVGFDLAIASSGLASFNFGGIFGALLGAWLMDRYGSRRVMIAIALLGVVTSAVFAASGFDSSSPHWLVIAGLGALGAFVSGLQVMLFALAASVYPAANRATGVGAALAIGRAGAVASSYTGAAVLDYGAGAYFSAIAISMFVVTGALVMVRNHSAPRRCVA